jgi:hypothetical protein
MWSKIVGVLVILIAASAAFVLYQNAAPNISPVAKPLEAERVARNIMLYELNTESGETSTLHAQKGFFRSDKIIDLFDITLNREDKLNITGKEATYNMDNSNLKVKGDILLRADDGSKAFLKDLTWEKSTKLINSDNPVRLEKDDGWLTGEKVEMADDLSRISFSGGVHAQVNRNFDIDN